MRQTMSPPRRTWLSYIKMSRHRDRTSKRTECTEANTMRLGGVGKVGGVGAAIKVCP